MKHELAPDVFERIKFVIDTLGLEHMPHDKLHCVRSFDVKTNAIARIWALPKVWRDVLDVEPQYIIEVVSKKYDKLPDDEKTKVLIHELMHIPKKFSGGLVPHTCFGKKINDKVVSDIYEKYFE